MQDEIWNQTGIQNYNGNVLYVYSVLLTTLNKTSYIIIITKLSMKLLWKLAEYQIKPINRIVL